MKLSIFFLLILCLEHLLPFMATNLIVLWSIIGMNHLMMIVIVAVNYPGTIVNGLNYQLFKCKDCRSLKKQTTKTKVVLIWEWQTQNFKLFSYQYLNFEILFANDFCCSKNYFKIHQCPIFIRLFLSDSEYWQEIAWKSVLVPDVK